MKTMSSLHQTLRKLVMSAAVLLGCGNFAFAVPYVFNASESAAPGDVIYLQGDNFVVNATNPTIWFHLVSGTDTALTPDVQLDSAAIASVTNQAITVNLPNNIPMGLYAVWVKDANNVLSAPVMINQARATSFEYGEVSPSYTFRIFGRNLCFPGVTPSVKFVNGSNSYTATVVSSYPNDSYILQVQAPSNLRTSGTFTVTVSNGYGHNATANFDVTIAEKTILGRAGGTDVFSLGAPWGPDFATIVNSGTAMTINPSGDTSGATDLANIRSALNIARRNANGGTVTLATGTYTINKGTDVTAFDIAGKVILKGAGIDQTIINDISPALSGYSHFITMSGTSPYNGSLSGVTGFTCNQLMTTGTNSSGAALAPPDIRNYAVSSSKMFFDHLKVNFAHGFFAPKFVIPGLFIPQCQFDTQILIQNCTMSYVRLGNNNFPGGGPTGGSNGSDYIFRNNTLTSTHGRLEFPYINNCLIEGNHFTRDGAFPPPSFGATINCGGIEATGADHKILNNTFDAINLPLGYFNDGETILCQAGPLYGGPSGTTDSGTVTSATNYSTTALTDTSKNWTANAYSGEIAWITSGPSQGYWGKINSNTATTLYLDRKWDTLPTTASQYAILPANSYVLSTVTGASSTTVTDTTQSWPTNFHVGDAVAIVNGQGMGQVRTIISNTLNTLTVSSPWDEIPNSTSRYSINGSLSFGPQRWLVYGNILQDVPRGIIYYMGAYDCVTVKNRLASAGGIFFSAGQRSWLNSLVYNRYDMGWNNLFADNVVSNPQGTGTNGRAAYYSNHADLTANSYLFGTLVLGLEHRRNILQSTTPNLQDNAFGSRESFTNIVIQETTPGTAYAGPSAILGTIFSDNLSISSSNAYEFSTASNQTTIWNYLMLSCTNSYMSIILPGGTQGALYTTMGGDPCFLGANFSGTGTITGRAIDLINTGATAILVPGNGQASINVSSANPFSANSGSYITIISGTTGNAGGYMQLTPTTGRTSWGRIFDGRMVAAPNRGKWLVNGGFDFFWRSAITPSAGGVLRPIDISNNSSGNGLRLVFGNNNASVLKTELITATNGGGVTITGTYAPGFVANQIYHLGVTYATNAITGVTTEKIFVTSGTGSIVTSGSGAATPIATGTFTLNPNIVTNTGGVLGNSTWNFGEGTYGVIVRANDYDCLRFYSQDPGVFPACGQ